MVHQIWNQYPLIQEQLGQVKHLMLAELKSPHPAIQQKIVDYIEAPGKYLRAGLCLLFSQLTDVGVSQGRLYLAAYLEVLHLATLIHDDVIDEADRRRGVLTAHEQFSNRIAVYTGDYLLVYAGRLAAKGAKLLQLDGSSHSSVDEWILEKILAGELAQLMNQFDVDMSLKRYLKQIQGKTAALFGLACQLGVLGAGWTKVQERQAYQAGQAFGMAFQLRDDLLDYRLLMEDKGKPSLQDIQNGIYTAPLLYALKDSPHLRSLLKEASNWEEVGEQIAYTQGPQQTESLIQAYLNKVTRHLKQLPAAVQDKPELLVVQQLLAEIM